MSNVAICEDLTDGVGGTMSSKIDRRADHGRVLLACAVDRRVDSGEALVAGEADSVDRRVDRGRALAVLVAGGVDTVELSTRVFGDTEIDVLEIAVGD